MAEYPDLAPSVDLRFGDCLAVLRELPDESVSAVVCDPPYGLADVRPERVVTALTAWANGDRDHVPGGRGFMGRAWDAFVPPPAVWDECLRVLTPGGHLLAFAGSRTADLMGLSVRMAGFEIRDTIMWVYGSGFPKGQDVGKAIDRIRDDKPDILPEAARWEGWNTSLKPAQEPIIVARKPLAGTVAAMVLAHGTGALNVDACRVEARRDRTEYGLATASRSQGCTYGTPSESADFDATKGRWPTNVVLTHADACEDGGACTDGCPVAELDRQSGIREGGHTPKRRIATMGYHGGSGGTVGGSDHRDEPGGASRYFPTFRYQAKAPARERPKIDGKGWPTVKPQGLMRWLVRLVTPPGGLVLDPFTGTGSTLQAARDEGFSAIGIERDEFAYLLACRRLGLPELVPVTVTDAETGEPVALADAAEKVFEPAPVDPVLVAIADADSPEQLLAVWGEHRESWSDDHTAAARKRKAELLEAA